MSHNISIDINGHIEVMSVKKARRLYYVLQAMLEQIDEFGFEEDKEEDGS